MGGIYLQTQSFTVIEVVRLINLMCLLLSLTVNVLFIIKRVLFISVVVLFGNYEQNYINIYPCIIN